MSVSGTARGKFDDLRDDARTQYDRLNEILEKRMRFLEEEEMKLEEERRQFEADKFELRKLGSSEEAVLEINVSGKVMQIERSTLVWDADSRLAALFGDQNRQESLPKDPDGRPFLSVNEYCFSRLIDFLRRQSRMPEDSNAPMPELQPDMKEEFEHLVQYFNISRAVKFNNLKAEDFKAKYGSIGISSRPNGEIEMIHQNQDHFPCISTKALKLGTQCRLRIEVMKNNHWINIGIIGTQNPAKHSYSDTTTYAWAGNNNQVWIAGQQNDGYGGHVKHNQGDIVSVELLETQVKFRNERLQNEVSLDIPADQQWFLLIGFYNQNDRVVLLPE